MRTTNLLAGLTLGLLLGAPGLAQAQFTTIDVPGATRTAVNGNNSPHELVGEYDDAAGHTHGFVLNKGVFTTIDVPDAALTSAIGLNDNGEVVGVFIDDEDFNEHAFVLSDGTYTTLDAPGADGVTVGQGVNNPGQVVGYYTAADGHDHG